MKRNTKTMKLHAGKVTIALAAIGLLVFSSVATFTRPESPVFANDSNPFYTPQYGRNAEWAGPINNNVYTDEMIAKIVRNNSYEIIPKFSDRFDIQKHFDDARRIVAAGNAIGNPIKVFEYYSGSFWFNDNVTGWGQYASGFKNDWLMKDGAGQPIPYFGLGAIEEGDQSKAYMIDDSNPEYRSWAIKTITAWMQAAPYKGIAFDSSNLLVGNSVRIAVGSGNQTWNDLLCGPGAPVDGQGNCSRVAAWNDGLTSLLREAKAAVAPFGGEVLYNGVAPSKIRTPARNTELLSVADITSNESFCVGAAAVDTSVLKFTSVADDIAMMQQIAGSGKKIFEITNFQLADRNDTYAEYCLGSFLMGWQPGSSYYIYHRNYSDRLLGDYPYASEQNLNLGNPTGNAALSGSVYTRGFQNGFVIVNGGDSPTTVTLPNKLVQFADGKQGDTYNAGSQVAVGARTSQFFLNAGYVNPSSATSQAGGGASGQSGGSAKGGQSTNDTNNASSGRNGTKPLNDLSSQPIDGQLDIRTPAIEGVVRIEYYIDATLVKTVTKFPDQSQIDTSTFKNGKHTLLTKYYYQDGSVTTKTQTINIQNRSLAGKLVGNMGRAALPAGIIIFAIGVLFFLFHRFGILIPRWFYHHNPQFGVVTHAASNPTSATYNPGQIVRPNEHHDDVNR